MMQVPVMESWGRPKNQYPQLYEYQYPGQYGYKYRVVAEKNPLMLGLSLIGAVVLIVLTVLYMLLLSKYIIEHKHHSVITGGVEAFLYILMFLNMILAAAYFYASMADETIYKTIEVYNVFLAIAYGAVHIVALIIWLIVGLSGNAQHMALLGLVILPALGELLVFGITAFGFYYLYKKSPFLLLPVPTRPF